MKKMLAKILFVTVAVFTVLAVPACSTVEQKQGSETQTAVTPPAASVTEKISARYLSCTINEKPDGDVEKEILADYIAANPNFDLELIFVPATEFMPKITAMITANDAPDLFSNYVQYLVALHDMGAMEPLTQWFGKDYVDGILPAVNQECMIDGELYAVPWSSIPTGLIYRADWFEELGLEVPKTFDDVTEAGKALTKDINGDNVIDRYGIALIAANNNSASSRFIAMLRNCGSYELLNINGEPKTAIGDEGSIKLLDYFYKWANVDKIVPPGAGEIGHGEAINLLAAEQAAMTFSGPHTIGQVLALNPSLKGKLAGAPMPTLKPGEQSVSMANITGLSISSKSKYKKEIADYLKFFTNFENFKMYNARSYRMPCHETLVDSVKDNTDVFGFTGSLESAYPLFNVTYSGDIHIVLAKALNACASGAESDAAKVAAEAKKQIEELIEKNK